MEQALNCSCPVLRRPVLLLGPLAVVTQTQRLHKVPVVRTAMGAADTVGVVGKEVETLVGQEQRLEALGALKQTTHKQTVSLN